MRKLITTIALIFIMMFTLVGCRKVVNVETQEVEVSIIDEYHRGSYITPVSTGKTTVMVTHPAVYKITVEYEGVEFILNGRDVYNEYSDKVGETTMGTLKITTFDDDSTSHEAKASEIICNKLQIEHNSYKSTELKLCGLTRVTFNRLGYC